MDQIKLIDQIASDLDLSLLSKLNLKKFVLETVRADPSISEESLINLCIGAFKPDEKNKADSTNLNIQKTASEPSQALSLINYLIESVCSMPDKLGIESDKKMFKLKSFKSIQDSVEGNGLGPTAAAVVSVGEMIESGNFYYNESGLILKVISKIAKDNQIKGSYDSSSLLSMFGIEEKINPKESLSEHKKMLSELLYGWMRFLPEKITFDRYYSAVMSKIDELNLYDKYKIDEFESSWDPILRDKSKRSELISLTNYKEMPRIEKYGR